MIEFLNGENHAGEQMNNDMNCYVHPIQSAVGKTFSSLSRSRSLAHAAPPYPPGKSEVKSLTMAPVPIQETSSTWRYGVTIVKQKIWRLKAGRQSCCRPMWIRHYIPLLISSVGISIIDKLNEMHAPQRNPQKCIRVSATIRFLVLLNIISVWDGQSSFQPLENSLLSVHLQTLHPHKHAAVPVKAWARSTQIYSGFCRGIGIFYRARERETSPHGQGKPESTISKVFSQKPSRLEAPDPRR